MSRLNITHLILFMLLTIPLHGQNKTMPLHLVDEQSNAIDGVCVGIPSKHLFWYSDTTGLVNLPLESFQPEDSITFIHLSYKPQTISIETLISLSNAQKAIQFESDFVTLEEVVVTPLNLKKLVEEAIAQIPKIYATSLATPMPIHAEIDVFDTNDSTSLVYYKGALLLSEDAEKFRHLTIRKGENSDSKEMANSLKKQLYPINLYHSANILSPERFGVIRYYDKFTFDKYQRIEYRGVEAIQVFFHYQRKKKITSSGNLIIEEDTKAIRAIYYTQTPKKIAIVSSVKLRLRYTGIDAYRTEASFSLNSDGLYEFESGMYYVQYVNRLRGKKKKKISLKVNFNKIPLADMKYGEEILISDFLMR